MKKSLGIRIGQDDGRWYLEVNIHKQLEIQHIFRTEQEAQFVGAKLLGLLKDLWDIHET